MAARSIEHWLDDIRLLNEDGHSIALAVRALMKREFKPLAEEIKYGGILFASGSQHFCGLFVYKAHVSVEFGQGSAMPDEYGLLEGSGKLRRHLKLQRLADIEAKQLAHYLKLAHHQAAQAS